jgi:hypothetical protein
MRKVSPKWAGSFDYAQDDIVLEQCHRGSAVPSGERVAVL